MPIYPGLQFEGVIVWAVVTAELRGLRNQNQRETGRTAEQLLLVPPSCSWPHHSQCSRSLAHVPASSSKSTRSTSNEVREWRKFQI